MKPKTGVPYRVGAALSQSGKKGEQICKQLVATFGGSICTPRPRKESHNQEYSWRIISRKMLPFLKQIYPYLKLKKEQAELAIEFQKYASSFLGGKHLSDVERIEKYSYYETAKQEMQFLNKRGK